MKKNCSLFFLTIVALFTLSSCNQIGSINPAEISAEHFTDGNHTRDDEYAASFPTKFVALDGLNIHFAATIFDERDSPELAKQIAADYAALAKLGNSLTKSVAVYLVGETTTSNPVATTSGLFCTPESVQNGTYRPFLTSCTFDLAPWWQCVGLSKTVFEETAVSSDELAKRLNAYYDQHEKPYLLTLSPLYFIENFSDSETIDLAVQSAQSLAAYIMSQDNVKAFLTEGNNFEYRNEWLKELGITVDTENISTTEAAYLSSLSFITAKEIPFIIEEQNFQLNLQSVDWMPTADDVTYFLVDFCSDVNQLYNYLKENAPKHYEALQQPDFRQISVSVFDSDSDNTSFAKPDGSKAVVLAHEGALHELTHCLIPANDASEKRWLCEGLTTYLSAPYLSYEIAPQYIDPFANETEIAKLKSPYIECSKKIAARYEQMTGQTISEIYTTEHPIFLIYQAIGYEAVLHPETFRDIQFPIVTQSVDKRAGVSSGYIGNQLSYLESMVFVQYLVEKHGLDAMIEAEMDNKTYRELFPDAAAFQEEYDNFVAQINFD